MRRKRTLRPSRPVLRLSGVRLVRDGRAILDAIDWVVADGERWVVLGPNGSGKTTLVKLAGAQMLPTDGAIEILGEQVGATDLRELRTRIAYVSGALLRSLRPDLTAAEIVVAGKLGWLNPWGSAIEDADHERARSLLARAGLDGRGDRPFDLLSEGERQQVLLARALMCPAEVVLMDEPAAGLDMGARERLVGHLSAIASSELRSVVFVTHHIEEVPAGFTHALLLRGGRVLAAGPVSQTLTSDRLSECFGLPLQVSVEDGRYSCRLRRPTTSRRSRHPSR